MTSRAKKRKYGIWRGTDKKRWTARKEQLSKMRKDEALIKMEKEKLKEKPISVGLLSTDLFKSLSKDRFDVGKLVSKTANSVMKFNPNAIVAVESRGVPAARLVQYYIEKKTGEKIKLYPIKPTGGKRLKAKPHTKLVPARKNMFKELKGYDKIALIDDVQETAGTKDSTIALLRESIGTEHQFGFFYLSKNLTLWRNAQAISPYRSKFRTPGERAHAFAYFQELRKLVDGQLEKEKLGARKK